MSWGGGGGQMWNVDELGGGGCTGYVQIMKDWQSKI